MGQEKARFNVLLIHPGIIPHYRVPIYNYLYGYLVPYGFDFSVISDGIQTEFPGAVNFQYLSARLSVGTILHHIRTRKIDVIIDFMELKNPYLFPTYILVKGILKRKMIYWGQGRDLLNPNAKMKNLAYMIEQAMCDAIILYGEHLKKYLPKCFHRKTFIANNTLSIDYKGLPPNLTKEIVLGQYGIKTKKNIICVGRMQKRKKVGHIAQALAYLNRSDIGLILVGPDPERTLDKLEGDNIFKLGSIYGDKKFDLLSSADVYCLPGAVGLSIVDAFHCGLPFVTEEGDESAEIMYLKNGVNGFIVPRNNIHALSEKLLLLLDSDDLKKRFGAAAKREIITNGNMRTFGSGFKKALFYATGQIDRGSI